MPCLMDLIDQYAAAKADFDRWHQRGFAIGESVQERKAFIEATDARLSANLKASKYALDEVLV